jgi:hypothetical protein
MEGYWLTHYESEAAHGDGIVMLHEGELVGGDLEHAWMGTYEEEPPKVYARIRISPSISHSEEGTMAREPSMIVNLSGFCTDEIATLDGHPEGREDLHYHVEMRKCRAGRPRQSELETKAA